MSKYVTIETLLVLAIVAFLAFLAGGFVGSRGGYHVGHIAGRNEVTLTTGEKQILALPEDTRKAIITALNQPFGQSTFTMKDISNNKASKIAVETLKNYGGKTVDNNPDIIIRGEENTFKDSVIGIHIGDTVTGLYVYDQDNEYIEIVIEDLSALGRKLATPYHKQQTISQILAKAIPQTPPQKVAKTQTLNKRTTSTPAISLPANSNYHR